MNIGIHSKKTFRHIVLIAFSFFLLQNNQIHAQGPNAPEAASFEPVDATDMVNLVTGNFSYVLPLLNVPSPEGGYPIALSYHAGIAMDQEASWVGLGWTLNPGAINRNVNGYPDDWGKTHVSEFFYQPTFEKDYYNFSIGGTLPNGVTLGVGASWGSNQAFGGMVSLGYFGVKATAGFGGQSGYYSIGYSGGAVSYGISTQGVNIGLGAQIGSLGTNIGYSTSAGFSGGFSLRGAMSSGENQMKSVSMGVSLSSSGASISGGYKNGSAGKTVSGGIGITNNSTSVSQNDYDITTTTKGLNLDFGAFWIGYQHKNVKYSLFKTNSLYVNGTLYPYKSNRLRRILNNNTVENTYFQEFGYLMDTYKINSSIWSSAPYYLLPSYDTYIINAQGLSGVMEPRTSDQMLLYTNGEYTPLGNTTSHMHTLKAYEKFIVDGYKGDANEFDLNNKTNFYFTNTYNSFLRIDKTFNNPIDLPQYFDKYGKGALESKTIYNDRYSRDITPNGNRIMGGENGYRKRAGNYIETFTNKEIRKNQINGFIEAKGIRLERRNNNNVLLDDGIGAYRITTTDGKTYHYSLPVYHYESFFRNYKGNVNPQSGFYEKKKLKPYATHWLLTAITGPDYYDKNNNGILDKNDYGYWVEFEYGKWSDGFAWRGPKGNDFNTIKKKNGWTDEIYEVSNSYTWGRKQVYYLDAIKTRTHTALFVKDIREDNMSSPIDISRKKYNGVGGFDIIAHGKNIEYNKRKEFALPGEKLYDKNNNSFETSFKLNEHNVMYYTAFEVNQKYVDLPATKSLKLSKIILVKNKQLTTDVSDLKTKGNLIDSIAGRLYINDKYKNVGVRYQINTTSFPINGTEVYYRNKKELKTIYSQLDKNVLDVSDLNNFDLVTNATKIIEFNTSYKLAGNVPNSNSYGKKLLTLNNVTTKGKNGKSSVPPYRFSYEKPSLLFDRENMDNWGYIKDNPDAWSLNEIVTPTGGKVKINYESDSFALQAAGLDEKIETTHHLFVRYNYDNSGSIKEIEKYRDYEDEIDPKRLKVFFNGNDELEHDLSFYYSKGDYVSLRFEISRYSETGSLMKDSHGGNFNYEVVEVKNNEWVKLMPRRESEFTDYSSLITNVTAQSHYSTIPFISNFKLTNTKSLSVFNDYNGKQRGGVRVKSITVEDNSNNKLTTEYDYRNPITKVTSGVTSYEPLDTHADGTQMNGNDQPEDESSGFVTQLPSPGVNYKYVQVSMKDNNDSIIGYSRYRFDVLKPKKTFWWWGNYEKYKTNFIYDSISDKNLMDGPSHIYHRKKYSITDKSSALGRILDIENYNGKNQLISSTVNNYKKDLDSDGEIGVTQESFLTYLQGKKSYNFPTKPDVYSSIISKTYYPSVLESTTTTQGGFTNTTYYDKYDFLTGNVIETTNISSDGTAHRTKVVPAYKIDTYGNSDIGYSMAAKVDNPTNKNMLTQNAVSLNQILVSDTWKTLGADITTWNKEWSYIQAHGAVYDPVVKTENEKIWRKHKTFVWKGELDTDGSYKNYTGNDDNFNWADPDNQVNADWINTSTINLYDHYSMPLEMEDINGNKMSTKMCDDASKIMVTANAGYTEMYYSGAEYTSNIPFYYDGEIRITGEDGQGNISPEIPNGSSGVKAHTGRSSVRVSSELPSFEVVMKKNQHGTGRYKISVWVDKGNEDNAFVVINGVSNTFNGEEVHAGNWVLKSHYIHLEKEQEYSIGIKRRSGDIIMYADDFRIHPIESSMTSYVYNEWDELTYIIGTNGLATKYEYDAAGRLRKTYAEVIDTPEIQGGFKLNKKINYNYKSEQGGLNFSLIKISSMTTENDDIFNNRTITKTKIKAAVSSGKLSVYEYRWAVGGSLNDLVFGTWTSSNTFEDSTEGPDTCIDGRKRYYKCEVRDKITGNTAIKSGSYTLTDCVTLESNDPDIEEEDDDNPWLPQQ